MKKCRKWILLVLLLAVVFAACGCALGGNKKIGKEAALQIALEDAGLTLAEAADIDVELDKGFSKVWYEASFDSGRTEYEYKIDAYTGEIISAAAEQEETD